MTTQAFGLTPAGFVLMRQSDIISMLKAQQQQAFGQNINFSGQAVLGQLMGIHSRPLSFLWELGEALYASQYPSGAEGTSVDNILALSNNKRKAATATKSAPTDTAGEFGLVFYGTAGTVIPALSLITVQGNASLQFQTDTAVTIAAAVNAIQKLLLSSPPTSGAFTFTLADSVGNVLTSPSLPWNTPTAVTQLAWSKVPVSGNFQLQVASALGTFLTPSRGFGVATAQIQTDIRGLNGAYSAVTVSGSVGGAVLVTTGDVAVSSDQLTNLASVVGIVIGMQITGANIPANTTVLNLIGNTVTLSQAATGTASGETITLSGALTINWGGASQPLVALTSDTLAPVAGVVYNSLQAAFNTLHDIPGGNWPYTDVTCTGSLAGGSVSINFGIGALISGQPTSGFQPQNTLVVSASTLQNGFVVVNTNVLTKGSGTATGAPAQGIGSATCTQTGPNPVPAGFLSVIGSPVSGWTAVTNPLDCITGTNAENDTEALARRDTELAANANGPVDAIAAKVEKVTNVVKAIGFQNLSLAALQVLTFSAVPTSGSFTLGLNGGLGLRTTAPILYRALSNVQALYFSGTPTGGYFTITLNSLTTTHIPFSANAATVQAAVQALTGFENALVTGAFGSGFFFSFGAGGARQYPISATDALTGASLTASVPSVQALINAVPGYEPATVIGSFASTFVVAFNGSTGGQAQDGITAPTNTLLISATPVTITQSFGRPGKSIEIVVNDNNGEASNLDIAEAIFGSAPGGILTYGNNLPSGNPTVVSDAFGNTYPIGFSRPTQVPFYVVISLQTDLTLSENPAFSIGSIATIQEDVAAIGNAFNMGALVIGFGSNGLIGAFNDVPGIVSYSLFFGTAPNPSSNANVQLLPEQAPIFETFNIIVNYQ